MIGYKEARDIALKFAKEQGGKINCYMETDNIFQFANRHELGADGTLVIVVEKIDGSVHDATEFYEAEELKYPDDDIENAKIHRM